MHKRAVDFCMRYIPEASHGARLLRAAQQPQRQRHPAKSTVQRHLEAMQAICILLRVLQLACLSATASVSLQNRLHMCHRGIDSETSLLPVQPGMTSKPIALKMVTRLVLEEARGMLRSRYGASVCRHDRSPVSECPTQHLLPTAASETDHDCCRSLSR